MRNMKPIALLLIVSAQLCFAQTVKVSGFVIDGIDGKALAYSTVAIGTQIGVTTDSLGAFKVDVPIGFSEIVAQCPTYKSEKIRLGHLSADTTLLFRLTPEPTRYGIVLPKQERHNILQKLFWRKVNIFETLVLRFPRSVEQKENSSGERGYVIEEGGQRVWFHFKEQDSFIEPFSSAYEAMMASQGETFFRTEGGAVFPFTSWRGENESYYLRTQIGNVAVLVNSQYPLNTYTPFLVLQSIEFK